MMNIKKIIVILSFGLIFGESKQLFATIQMLDQVVVLDLENLQVNETINTEFVEDSQCSALNNENDCMLSDSC